MEELLKVIGEFAAGNPTVFIIVIGLFGVSETLSYIPSIRANGVFQLISGLLSKLKSSFAAKPEVQ